MADTDLADNTGLRADRSAPVLDVAARQWIGRRPSQEDALAYHIDDDRGDGIVVLSDGMGGHLLGEVASEMVVDVVFRHLDENFEALQSESGAVPDILAAAAERANDGLRDLIAANSRVKGMGATLVALFVAGDRLWWVSVGDSPLYRIRDGKIEQLNDDHSMGKEIDFMVENGLIPAEAGPDHPDRNNLKSAISGGPIKLIDCPDRPRAVRPGDIYVLASDGLQTLSDEEIGGVVDEMSGADASVVAMTLLRCVEAIALPEQDNVSVSVIKIG